MSTSNDKEQVIASLKILTETCKAALSALADLSRSTAGDNTIPVDVLRKDYVSINRLIYGTTSKLSVALGKPPPSYALAPPPIKELSEQAGQLVSCTSTFPQGVLRKEAVWAAEETVQALDALAKHFLSNCALEDTATHGDDYLTTTGAVHAAVEKAVKISDSEREAIAKAWKANAEGLSDSLGDVKEMMEEQGKKGDNEDEEDGFDDGWDEFGKEFQKKLSPEERERVAKIYPLLRFASVLHDKLLSQYILKAPSEDPIPVFTINSLFTFSNSLLVATDDLVVTFYSPQDLESIQEGIELVYGVVQDLDNELRFTASEPDKVAQELKRLHLGSDSKHLLWFKKCFLQIYSIYNNLSLGI